MSKRSHRSHSGKRPDGMDILAIVLIAPIAGLLVLAMLPIVIAGHLYNYLRHRMEIPR